MKVKCLAECISSVEKESKDGNSFYISTQFNIDGHKVYVSSDEPIAEEGKNYIITGDLQVTGQKVYLNLKPKDVQKTDFNYDI